MIEFLGKHYEPEAVARISEAIDPLLTPGSATASLSLEAGRKRLLRHIRNLADAYVDQRELEHDRLLQAVDERLRRDLERSLREADLSDLELPRRHYLQALERNIKQLREAMHKVGMMQDFRQDLRALKSGRLRLRHAREQRVYAPELMSALRFGAFESGIDDRVLEELDHTLEHDRELLRRAAQAALDNPLFRSRSGPLGDAAAVAFAAALDRHVIAATGKPISVRIRTDSTRRDDHHGPGFRLLLACLQPLKPSLTAHGAVGLMRQVRAAERRHAQLHGNS